MPKTEIDAYALQGQRYRLDIETKSQDSKTGAGALADPDDLDVIAYPPDSASPIPLVVIPDGVGAHHCYVDLVTPGLWEIAGLSDQVAAPEGTRGANVYRIYVEALPS